jgi:hypothetical protein
MLEAEWQLDAMVPRILSHKKKKKIFQSNDSQTQPLKPKNLIAPTLRPLMAKTTIMGLLVCAAT